MSLLSSPNSNETQMTRKPTSTLLVAIDYEGCSNMNASRFITFLTYMLRQNAIPFWKELLVAFKMAPKHIETLTIFLELQTLI